MTTQGDALADLDAALAALEAAMEDDDASSLVVNEREAQVETAWDRLSEASADGLDDRIRARLQASLKAREGDGPLPSQWLAVLSVRGGLRALPDLLAASDRRLLVDGGAVNALLNDLVERHPDEARPLLVSAIRSGPHRLPAIVALSYLPPDEGDGLAACQWALAQEDAELRAVAATYLGHSDWWTPLRDRLRALAKSDPDEAVRAAAEEARAASEG